MAIKVSEMRALIGFIDRPPGTVLQHEQIHQGPRTVKFCPIEPLSLFLNARNGVVGTICSFSLMAGCPAFPHMLHVVYNFEAKLTGFDHCDGFDEYN